ncbi:phosphatidate cytidylyltransferase [Mesonia hippocampi]|uniref:Phosphatidate cytidylyltransferase n=1 Tax=Mesonia hippocampi TaxID=1628250 RepID=A0A840EKB6_9FLAO|nr:phosphatidate cytidylyltransferase [Mesonia hippocampi]MBB4118819.1 phosphatidate cytidylyltransferase [Mesonia hippocampi]
MSETLTRSISGALYIILLISATYFSEYSFYALLAFFGIGSLIELQKLLQVKNYFSYLLLIFSILYFSIYKDSLSDIFLLIPTLIFNALLIKDLFSTHKTSFFKHKKHLFIFFYLIAAIVFMLLIPFQEQKFTPLLLISCYTLIWVNDSFAYLVGKNLGKHKLLERISPKKTIEGFLGGAFFSILASYILYICTDIFTSFIIWLGLSLIITITGTLGDLIQSKLKRQANVKDSGKIMPGHGGLLDRLDSILFSSTFIYTYMLIINYVS